MDSLHCKDCGNPLQDSFVIVDPEREDELNSKWRNTKSSKNVVASLNATLKLKGKITDLVERSTKVTPRSREAKEVSQNKSKHKQVKFQDIEGFSEEEKDKKIEAKNRKLEICFDCRRLLLEELDKQTQEAQLERTNYMQYAHRALNSPLRPEEVKQEKQRLMTEILQVPLYQFCIYFVAQRTRSIFGSILRKSITGTRKYFFRTQGTTSRM